MSHDNYKENPQEATIRAAVSMVDFGMFCVRKYMEECSNLMKLSSYFSKSYSEIFYGNGVRAEKLFVKPVVEMDMAPDTAPEITIPIHEIKEVVYDKISTESPTDAITPILQKP
jgi:hypothetical protein